jgi:hypothetical protein
MIYAGKRQAQARGKVEKLFDYLQRRFPIFSEKHRVKDCSQAQKIVDDLVLFTNDHSIHEETREIPARRGQETIHNVRLDPN